jgi:hypothetical protein
LALASHQLKVHQSASLLACQRGRERRRRVDVLRAEQACATAVVAETLAREQRDSRVALCAVELADAHQAIRGRVIDLDELKRLTTVEKGLQQEAVAAESALSKAVTNLREAESALANATAWLRSEVKHTRTREKSAANMLSTLRRATEAAAEREDADRIADSWNAT